MLNLRRERTKDVRKRSAKNSSPSYDSNITVEELDQIKQRSEERKSREQHYNLKMAFVFLGVAIAVILLASLLWTITVL